MANSSSTATGNVNVDAPTANLLNSIAANNVNVDAPTANFLAASSNNAVPYQLAPNPDGLGGYVANPSPIASTADAPLSNNTTNIDPSQLVSPVVITEGLDAMPWYSDPGLITGNPRLRQEVQPVSFQVMLHDNADFLLSSNGETGTPIQVELNASMKSVNWSMKHLYNHQRTRTAHHITMWGLQADTIEGQCTTGVFMNQFGLTDYYSTRTVNDKLKALVATMFNASDAQGVITNNGQFINNSNSTAASGVGMVLGSDGNYYPANSVGPGGAISTASNNTGTVLGSDGNYYPANSVGIGGLISTSTNSSPDYTSVMNAAGVDPTSTSAFRVAAQDAFMEFLALFKMNGSVWFWNKLYQGTGGTENRDWTQIEAWSPVLGMSSSQKNARNNDVLTRGGVIMSYRNFVYQGYFKSLQWTIDARNPFKWDFSFVFQVERTVGQQFIPHS